MSTLLDLGGAGRRQPEGAARPLLLDRWNAAPVHLGPGAVPAAVR